MRTNPQTLSEVLSVQAHAAMRMKTASIENISEVLATLMQDIHGGSWKAEIDHGSSTAFVLICPKNSKPLSRPKRGEIA